MGESWFRPAACIVAFELVFALVIGRYLGYVAPPPIIGYLKVAALLLPLSIPLFVLWHVLRLKWAPNPTRVLLARLNANKDLLGALILGVVLVLTQKMALTWAKPALGKTGFWADPPIAELERTLLGGDAWQYAHLIFGPRNGLIDWIYALWFPAILTVFFFVLTSRHELKSRVIVTYFLAVATGIVLQFALPSGGPIFYSRLGFGDQFSALYPAVPERAFYSASYLFWSHMGFPGGVAIGISAWPSIHITTTTWTVIAAWALKRSLLPIVLAWWVAIVIGSVYLGWHYLLDGVAGAAIAVMAYAVLSPRSSPRRFLLSRNISEPAR